ARDSTGKPAALRWRGDDATVSAASGGRSRSFTYDLVADATKVDLGWFLLGSMRVERDLQYSGRHQTAFRDAPFRLPEFHRLLSGLNQLEPPERKRHLALLGARTVEELRSRLNPTLVTRTSGTRWTARIVQPSLDARDTIVLELSVDPRRVRAGATRDSILLAARSGR